MVKSEILEIILYFSFLVFSLKSRKWVGNRVMRIVQASEHTWRGNQLRHRKGRISIKRLLDGEPGSPENFGLHIGRESEEFFSPRHRHPWDQIRYCISGRVPIGPDRVIDAGEIGYFPEGVYYGPQKGPERSVMVLQFGGASGQGYINRDIVNNAYDELGQIGQFANGRFQLKGGTKKTLDGYEAIWQHVTGRALKFPRPRYSEPVVLRPKNFLWRNNVIAGVRQKDLGRFSDRGTEITLYQIEGGRRRVLQSNAVLRVVFVLKGRGKCGTKEYKRHSALEFLAEEKMTISPVTRTELLIIAIPSVRNLGLK